MSGVKGRSGRPRLSADEHQLRGTYRADRHGPLPPASALNDVEQPASVPVDPPRVAAPRDLSRAERAYWTYFSPLLTSARVLTPADRDTLGDYCRACAAVTDRNRRLGRAFRHRPFDNQLVRLLDGQLRGWIDKKTRLASELGLTASSRTRIKWTGHHQWPPAPATPDKPQSKLAQLQERAAALRRPLGVK